MGLFREFGLKFPTLASPKLSLAELRLPRFVPPGLPPGFRTFKQMGLLFCLAGVLVSGPAIANSDNADTSYIRAGFPGRRVAAGPRCGPSCALTNSDPLALLIPANNLLVTAEQDPTFLIHLPAIDSDSLATARLEFYLQDLAQGEILHRTVTAIPSKKSGIGRFTLSSLTEDVELEVGEIYHWGLILHCDCDHHSRSISAQGNVVVLASALDEANSEVQLMEAGSFSEREQERILQGLAWSQAIDRVDLLRRTQPIQGAHSMSSIETPAETLVEEQWQALLREADLADFSAAAPIDLIFSEL